MNKVISRKRRIKRVRAKIIGTAKCPRFTVIRSLRYIYAEIIDDENGKTLVACDSRKMPAPKGRGLASGGKKAKNDVETAGKIGEEIAKLAIAKKISEVVFDKRGYKYHGKVKALADEARKGGLKF